MGSSKKRGRPRKNGALKSYFGVRLDEERVEKMTVLMQELDRSSPEVIRLAIDSLYSRINK